MHSFSVTTDILQISVKLVVHDRRVFKSTRRRNAFKNVLFMLYRVRKISISKLLEAIGETKQRSIAKQMYVGRASLQIRWLQKWIWLRMQVKQKDWSILKKFAVLTNLEQIFKREIIGFISKPKLRQKKFTCGLKNIILVPGGSCCHFKVVDNE